MNKAKQRLIALLTIPLVLLLSSCIRMTADYTITGEDDVRLVADIGVLNSAAASMGSDMPDLCTTDDLGDVENAEVEPYTEEGDAGYTGCRISGTSSAADITGDGASITLADDVWTFAMDGDESAEEMGAEMFSDFRVSVTFPGKVLTHNGSSTVEGNTVTWSSASDLLSAEGLQATAENGSGSLTWLWIVLGVLALAAIAAALFLMTRKKKERIGTVGGDPNAAQGEQYPANPGQPYPGQQPQQYGQPQQPGQPYPGPDTPDQGRAPDFRPPNS